MRRIVMGDWSWKSVIGTAWEMTEGEPHMRADVVAQVYGPAVVEQIIRDEAGMMGKLTPGFREIEQAYTAVGGADSRLLDRLHASYSGAVTLSDEFGDANGDGRGVSWSNRWAAAAQVIYILASKFESPVDAQTFMRSFFPDRERLKLILSPDEYGRWTRYELEAGLGQLAAIAAAQQSMPNLQPRDLAAWMLKKYGIPGLVPDKNGEMVEVYGCAWCGSPPCFCKGRRHHLEETQVGPKRQTHGRKITIEDVFNHHLHRGPIDTLRTMRIAYGFGNASRAGSSFGAFRAMLELVVEGGVQEVLAESRYDVEEFRLALGPFFKPDQFHVREIMARASLDRAAHIVEHTKERGDMAHWQHLFWPPLNLHEGIKDALAFVAANCEIELVMPPLPQP